MTKLPSLLPDAGLLREVQGIEQGLRKRRRIGALGWAGLILASAAQLTVVVANNLLLDRDFGALAREWPLLVPLFILALSFVLVVWTRFWLQESKEPFRYTFSIAEFGPVGTTKPNERLAALATDLGERLSDRIRRLSRLDEKYVLPAAEATAKEAETRRSHLHVSGYYTLRERSTGLVMEVTPWVRVGRPGEPESLALPVKFGVRTRQKGGDAPSTDGYELSADEYEQIVERVYASIATEIYAQIEGDVARKIDLLPSRYFRAVAYFHEAEDYARSNTLDAYTEAAGLYERTLELYDPAWRRLPGPAWRHPVLSALYGWMRLAQASRTVGARIWPRLGRIELMIARARIGYARMLLYRRALAGISGQRENPVFEARSVAEAAAARLAALPQRPEQRAAQFDASVTLSLAWSRLDNWEQAEFSLEEARRLLPARAERDPVFLFARAQIEPWLVPTLQTLRRAVEANPKFQVAQFELARYSERLWRMRGTLEKSSAQSVVEEYRRVLELNPGIVGAWAGIGYVRWLLGDRSGAREVFERGRDYREIQSETFVSELDYGLARIAAEEGDFRLAYSHYVLATSSLLAHGATHIRADYMSDYFDRISPAILERFARYRERVERELGRQWRRKDPGSRIRDSVYAFVLNDHGDALLNAYYRFGERRLRDDAGEVLREATRRSEKFLFPYYNLSRVCRDKVGEASWDAHAQLERVNHLDPSWAQGVLALATVKAEIAGAAPARASAATEEAQRLRDEALAHRDAARALREGPGHDDPEKLERLAEEKEEEADRTVRKAQRDENEKAQPRLSAESLKLIASLLPHAWFWDGKRSRIDAQGLSVAALLGERIDWVREHDDLQVAALLTWALILSLQDDDRAVEAAGRLCDHLCHYFGLNSVELLGTRIAVARRRLERAREANALGEALGHARLILSLGTVVRRTVRRWLEWDASYAGATWIRWIGDELRLAGDLLAEYPTVEAFEDLGEACWRVYEGERGAERAAAAAFERAFREIDLAAEVEPAYEQAMKAYDSVVDREKWPQLLHEIGARGAEIAEKLESVAPQGATVYLEPWLRPDGAGDAYARGATVELQADLLRLRERLASLDRSTLSRNARLLSAKAYGAAASAGSESWGDRARAEARAERFKQLFILGDRTGALEELDSLAGAVRSGVKTSFSGLLEELLPSVETPEDYAELKRWLETEAQVAEERAGRAHREDLHAALTLLVSERYLPLVREADEDAPVGGSDLVALPSPITIEADETLFPDEEGWSDEHPLFRTYLPDLREAIRRETGIRVPGVSVRGSPDLEDGDFEIRLHELALHHGSVQNGLAFCPDGDSCLALGLDGEVDLGPTGEPGFWLEENAARRAERAGLRVWTHLRHLVLSLEPVVRAHLDTFLDVQEAGNMLEQWRTAGAPADQVDELVGDSQGLETVAYVLRRLARQRVPLLDGRAIVRVCFEERRQGRTVEQIVDAVRLALRRRLPGNAPGWQLVGLSEAFESALGRLAESEDGSAAAFVGQGRRLAEALHRAVGRDTPKVALVVREPGLRAPAERLLEARVPFVPVLAEGELLGGRAAAIVDRLPLQGVEA